LATVYKYGAANSGLKFYSSPKSLAQDWVGGGGATRDIENKGRNKGNIKESPLMASTPFS
jgi:hypothetical protein